MDFMLCLPPTLPCLPTISTYHDLPWLPTSPPQALWRCERCEALVLSLSSCKGCICWVQVKVQSPPISLTPHLIFYLFYIPPPIFYVLPLIFYPHPPIFSKNLIFTTSDGCLGFIFTEWIRNKTPYKVSYNVVPYKVPYKTKKG